jgi:hypothetical protein
LILSFPNLSGNIKTNLNTMYKFIQISLNVVGWLFTLSLNSSVIYFEINTNLDRPSVEFSRSEKSCSKDSTFKICGNVRLRSTNAVSTRRARIIYLGISKRTKQAMKAISRKRSRK